MGFLSAQDAWEQRDHGDYRHVSWTDASRCQGQGHQRRGPGIYIAVNGAKHVKVHCLDCGRWFGTLGSKAFNDAQLPLIADRRRDANACPHPYTEPALVIAADGRERWARICGECTTELAILRHVPPGGRLANRIIDHRVDDEGFAIAPPCDHCGAHEGSQEHHWAPRALFSDPNRWPTAWLCVACHELWHRVVTPTLGRKTA